MGFKIKLNNINVPSGNEFKVFYKLNSRTPGNVMYQSDLNWGTLYGSYVGGVNTNIEIEFDSIDPNPYGKQNWFKILDLTTGSYIIENLYIHEYQYYKYCIDCCTYEGGTATYIESCDFGGTAIYNPLPTSTPTPTSTNTSTPTPIPPTSTPTPTSTSTNTPIPTTTPVPPTSTPTPTSTSTNTPTPTSTNTPTPTSTAVPPTNTPIPITYNCDGTNCYEVYDGTGSYAFLSDCQLNCGQTGGGGGGCFVSGTTITMSDGTDKLIEELIVGDSLMSFDILGLPLYSDDDTVLDTWTNTNIIGELSQASIVSITPLEITEIIVINDLLKTTPNHRHLTKRNEIWSFKQADEVIVGDIMLDMNNNEIEVTTTDLQSVNMTVYKMNIESLDVFYANGILTHNDKPPMVTE